MIDHATVGLFQPVTILKDLSPEYVLMVRPKYYEMTVHSITANLEEMLPNVKIVEAIKKKSGFELLYYQGTDETRDEVGVTFDHLPSGTRNFAALILDLLIRFTSQQKDINDISEFRGIVIIDEIDLHLHPKMQREIVVQLSATFPNIQFIVTTHSPIPLLGANKESVFIHVYKNDKREIVTERLDINITNMLPNTLLSSPIFNFNELVSQYHDPGQRLVTEDDYTDVVFYRILAKKIQERSINPLL